MTHKFTHPTLEKLYIQSLTESELLVYFDEKSKETSKFLSWRLAFELDEEVFSTLFSRKSEIVDVALSKIANRTQTKHLFERYKKLVNVNGVDSFSLPLTIAIALLGNPNTFCWSHSQSEEFYLMRQWLYHEAELDVLDAVIKNLNAPQEMFKSILRRDELLTQISEERYLAILHRVLISSKIGKSAEDNFDYDMSQHDLIQLAWESLLKVSQSKQSAFYVRDAIQNIAPFEVSWTFAKERGLDEEASEDNKYFQDDCYQIRVSLIERIPNYLMKSHKKKIFSLKDVAYRVGFYKSIESYAVTIDELEYYLKTDGRVFLAAVLDNDSFFLRASAQKLLWLQQQINDFVEEEDLEVWETLTSIFLRRFEALGKSNSHLYFDGSVYDIQVQVERKAKASEKTEDELRLTTSFEHLQKIKGDISEMSDALSDSTHKKLVKKYAEMFEILSKRIGESDSKRANDEQVIFSKIEDVNSQMKKYFLIMCVVVVAASMIF